MTDIPDLSLLNILNKTEEHKIEVEISNKNKDRENKNHLLPSKTNQLQTQEMSSASSATPENKIISVSAPTAPLVPSKECSVCFDPYNKSVRARVTCQSCGYEACRQCYATFILDTSNTLPNCMNCHKEFQREFLVDNFNAIL